MTVGLYVDGWAHRNLNTIDTFFTPWHAMFYSGFVAVGAWLAACTVRLSRAPRAVGVVAPAGYEVAVAGFVVFGAGGIFDWLWHTVRGIEQDLTAVMSAPHLVLMTGGMLILSAPFRAAWLSSDDREPSYPAFVPAVVALVFAMSLVTLFMMFHWGFEALDYAAVPVQARFTRHIVDTDGARRAMSVLTTTRGYMNVLLSNVLLFGPVLLMVRRWRTPFGTVATYFAGLSALMSALTSFHAWEWVGVAAAAGLGVDVLIHLLRPAPDRVRALRAVAVAGPLLLWSVYFGLVAVRYGLAWPVEIWTGTIIWTGLTGWGLSLLVAPVATVSRRDTRPAR
jgi:hypothetical protein